MLQIWNDAIKNFIKLSGVFNVRMIMIDGWAVYYHGYKRHSADVDFWIEPIPENFQKLIEVFKNMGYEIEEFP